MQQKINITLNTAFKYILSINCLIVRSLQIVIQLKFFVWKDSPRDKIEKQQRNYHVISIVSFRGKLALYRNMSVNLLNDLSGVIELCIECRGE